MSPCAAQALGKARRRSNGFIPCPEATPGAGGDVGTTPTVLAPLGTTPRGSARRPPTGCVSPRSWGHAGSALRRETRAAVWVAQRPQRHRPESAVRALSGAGHRAPLRLLRESVAPGFPSGSRVTPRRVVPPARGHVQCHTGGSWDARELGLCFRHSWPHIVTGGRGSLASAVPSLAQLLFQCRAPGGEFRNFLS